MISIHAGRVLGPAGGPGLKVGVALDGDRIAGISSADRGETEGTPGFSPRERTYRQITKTEGLMAAPGLADVHVHFRDPGPMYEEDIHTGARAAVRSGFTTTVCMVNMNPIVNNEEILYYVLEEGKKTGTHVLSCVAVSKGFADRELIGMEGLLVAGVAGFTDNRIPSMDDVFVRTAMEEAVRPDTVLSFHEEDERFIRENGINHSRISDELGTYGSSALAEGSLVARDCMIALDAGATMDIQHINSGHSAEVVRLAKRLETKVWTEVTPHHFILTEEAVLKRGILAKMNPPSRTERDKWMPIEGLKDGTIDIIITDYAPHSREERERSLTQTPNDTPELETVLTLGVINLVKAGYPALSELMEKMSLGPVRLYKPDCGHMEPGAPVDLVLSDADRQWTVGGFESKSANGPLLGGTLTGKVIYTVCGGRVVYGE